MAHHIGQMFYVGETPWHHLGTHLPQPARLEDALHHGGLNWTVALEPLTLRDRPGVSIPQRMAVVRSDRHPTEPGHVLGVVHPQFRPLQNREAMELLDQLLGIGEQHYTTGGFLKNGEVVWLQANLPESMTVAQDDELKTYLLFSNSHDGSYPIDIRITTVRVVCNNTLNLALRDKDKTRFFRRGHNGHLEVVKQAAKDFFLLIEKTQSETTALMKRLVDARCHDKAFEDFIASLLPTPAAPLTSGNNAAAQRAHATRVANIKAARQAILEVHHRGYVDRFKPDRLHKPAPDNWWGALNTVTAWVDHLQEIEGDRFAHALFGTGDALKNKAFVLALKNSGSMPSN